MIDLQKMNTTERKKIIAFTLIEVLVAAVIFSLVVTALYTTYSTGLNSYKRSQRNREMQQNARAVFDLVGKDLRSVYWQISTSYNILSPEMEQKFNALGFYDYDDGNDDEDDDSDKDDNEESPLENYEHIKFDLTFKGTPQSVSFVRYQSDEASFQREDWNLARIKYSLKNGSLVRSISDVTRTEFYNYYTGEKSELEEEPTDEPKSFEEVVAKNIVEFDLKYLYFYEDEWRWTDSWDSESAQYRNPADYEDEEESKITILGYDPLEKTEEDTNIPDGLPSCIKIAIVVQNRTNEKILKKYETIIDMPSSLETWIKEGEDEDLYEQLGEESDSTIEKLGERL